MAYMNSTQLIDPILRVMYTSSMQIPKCIEFRHNIFFHQLLRCISSLRDFEACHLTYVLYTAMLLVYLEILCMGPGSFEISTRTLRQVAVIIASNATYLLTELEQKMLLLSLYIRLLETCNDGD
jgi:hypothetical protein